MKDTLPNRAGIYSQYVSLSSSVFGRLACQMVEWDIVLDKHAESNDG